MVASVVAGCAPPSIRTAPQSPQPSPVVVKIVAFNDFHGNLLPPQLAVPDTTPDGQRVALPAGGAAYLASAIKSLIAQNPNHAIVSAGDMIGASPLVSALFLDEPTIEVFNELHIDFNAVGNHEFDKGQDELLRMQYGGCQKYAQWEPCQVNRQFAGASFGFLAANVIKANGQTLLPGTGIKSFGTGANAVKVGFIGMTLKGTPDIVTPSGVAGLTFADESATANALVPGLRAAGAQAIVVLLHQGGQTRGGYNDDACPGLSGDILPILEQLDGSIDVVVSGHTHRSYLCDYARINPAKHFLLTSAGQYGTLLTDIDLTISPAGGKVISKTARNVVVQSEAFANAAGRAVMVQDFRPRYDKDPAVDRIVMRYAQAAAPLTGRPVGQLRQSLTRERVADTQTTLGNVIADAQLAATASPERGGSRIALMNAGGVRADLLVPPGGAAVTYGQIFSVQPFGNNLVVRTFTGAHIASILEQQFSDPGHPRLLSVSRGFVCDYLRQPKAGQHLQACTLDGQPLAAQASYRVTMNSFLASGGDGFSTFRQGTHDVGGVLDVEAVELYLATHPDLALPDMDRVRLH